MAPMVLTGIPAAPGIAIGKARIRLNQTGVSSGVRAASPEAELARFGLAVERARTELGEIVDRIASRAGEHEADIFRSQLLMLDDPLLAGAIKAAILEDAFSAEDAVNRVARDLAGRFRALEDRRLQERAVDVGDVGQRLARNLSGAREAGPAGAGIRFAPGLTPSEVSLLDPAEVAGIVTEQGGATGHAAILARALNIAAVMGLKDVLARVCDGDSVIVDGTRGEVILHPDQTTRKSYRGRCSQERAARGQFAGLRDLPAITLDGFRVEVSANITGRSGVAAALAAGAESVGIVRTEFLFLDRETMPSEDEQFEVYREMASGMAPRKVVIRTLDAGGDKNLPYCNLPREENPALGLRGIRLCLERDEIFLTQLRAVSRAAAFGNVAIMLPMISDLSEVRRTRECLRRAGAGTVSLGIMIETPAAAVMAEDFAREVDFLSIGTNDLTQYVLAVDRLNEHVAALYQPFHPAVLRLIRGVSDAAGRCGKLVGVCGEMAADPLAAPLFVGMGMGELSMAPQSIPAIKSVIRRLRKDEAARLTAELLALDSAGEIVAKLRQYLDDLAHTHNPE